MRGQVNGLLPWRCQVDLTTSSSANSLMKKAVLAQFSSTTKDAEEASYTLRYGAKMPNQCQEYANLQHEVQLTLQALSDLTKAMLAAFHSNDRDLFSYLDKGLEMTVGRKERTIGALRQHLKEHKCTALEL